MNNKPTKPCKHCGDLEPLHWPFQCKDNPKPKQAIKKRSERQIEYHKWLEQVARPYLIERDGNDCFCCGRPCHFKEKLDIEHTKPVGSNPQLKRSLSNMRLYCRFPCHRNKTDGKPCVH